MKITFPKIKTQKHFYYEAEKHAAERDRAFLDIAFHSANPMTRAELARNIERRPALWSRYAGYLDKLA